MGRKKIIYHKTTRKPAKKIKLSTKLLETVLKQLLIHQKSREGWFVILWFKNPLKENVVCSIHSSQQLPLSQGDLQGAKSSR